MGSSRHWPEPDWQVDGVLDSRGRAGEASFHLARARAAVAVQQVAVVALLAWVEVAVAAGRACRPGSCRCCPGSSAPSCRSWSSPCRRRRRGRSRPCSHSADCSDRCRSRTARPSSGSPLPQLDFMQAPALGRASRPGFGLASAGATVAAGGVAVVARFRSRLTLSPHKGAQFCRERDNSSQVRWSGSPPSSHRHPRYCHRRKFRPRSGCRCHRPRDSGRARQALGTRSSLPAGRALAATVAANGVAVIALLGSFDDTVAALAAVRTIGAGVGKRGGRNGQPTAHTSIRTATASGAAFGPFAAARATDNLGTGAA